MKNSVKVLVGVFVLAVVVIGIYFANGQFTQGRLSKLSGKESLSVVIGEKSMVIGEKQLREQLRESLREDINLIYYPFRDGSFVSKYYDLKEFTDAVAANEVGKTPFQMDLFGGGAGGFKTYILRCDELNAVYHGEDFGVQCLKASGDTIWRMEIRNRNGENLIFLNERTRNYNRYEYFSHGMVKAGKSKAFPKWY